MSTTHSQTSSQVIDYLGLFRDRRNVENEFQIKLDESINILIAAYENSNYSGHAIIIFEQFGELGLVHGSHCSCMGLEDQWIAESTNVNTL